MGIKGAHKQLSYCLLSVTIDEIESIGRLRCVTNLMINNHRSKKPILDVDVSWIYRRFASQGKDALDCTIRLCLVFVKIGFIVVLVCDGSVRHHTKRATIARSINSYKNQIDILEKKNELMKIADKRRQSNSVVERETLEKEELLLSDQIKRKESSFQHKTVDVGKSLFDDIKDIIAALDDELIGEKGGSITVCQAIFQADSVIASRCNKRISDLVLGSDTDLSAHCGSLCLGIKEFKFVDNNVSEMELFASCNETICNIAQIINVDTTIKNKRIINPPCPVFEGIMDPRVRALMCVGLGCDVVEKNLKTVTPHSLFNFLVSIKLKKVDDLYNEILNFFINKHFSIKKNTNLDDSVVDVFRKIINIYVESYMYEPSSYFVGEENYVVNNKTSYIHGKIPTSLHVYTYDFADNNNNIIIRNDEIDCGECVGPGSGTHCFLKDGTNSICTTCNREICSICNLKYNTFSYCIDCYVSEKNLPDNITNEISIEEMRLKLREAGIDILVSDPVSDVTDLYDVFIVLYYKTK